MSDSPEKQHKKGASVFTYLAIMFAAAFLLLLLAYFIQQRNNALVIDELKQDSLSSIQSIDDLLEEKRTLQQERTELQSKVEELEQKRLALQNQLTLAEEETEKQKSSLQGAVAELSEAYAMLEGWKMLSMAESAFISENYSECAMYLSHVPSTAGFTADAADRYNELVAAVQEQGFELTEN